MKAIQPFILGLFGGLALSLALLAGLYFSPLRESAYFAADPEMAQVRAKLSGYQEWINQADLTLAAKEDQNSDSLRAAQTVAWREYKKWRTHLGELAREHAKPTAEGLWSWTYSLRYWAAPGAAVLCLLPALLLAWRSRDRFAAARHRGRKTMSAGKGRAGVAAGRTEARAQALAQFEDAVKKVARLSESGMEAEPDRGEPDRNARADDAFLDEPPTEAVPAMHRPDAFEPPTTPIRSEAFSEGADMQDTSKIETTAKEPETKPMELIQEVGSETGFRQDPSAWGESQSPRPEAKGAVETRGSAETKGSGLDMEDEDEPAEETLGVMPPTTEVERVERRKEEVLKLARKGMTSSEISRRMRISQDQVEFIIRLRREKG